MSVHCNIATAHSDRQECLSYEDLAARHYPRIGSELRNYI
jgi:hypothetical protein